MKNKRPRIAFGTLKSNDPCNYLLRSFAAGGLCVCFDCHQDRCRERTPGVSETWSQGSHGIWRMVPILSSFCINEISNTWSRHRRWKRLARKAGILTIDRERGLRRTHVYFSGGAYFSLPWFPSTAFIVIKDWHGAGKLLEDCEALCHASYRFSSHILWEAKVERYISQTIALTRLLILCWPW